MHAPGRVIHKLPHSVPGQDHKVRIIGHLDSRADCRPGSWPVCLHAYAHNVCTASSHSPGYFTDARQILHKVGCAPQHITAKVSWSDNPRPAGYVTRLLSLPAVSQCSHFLACILCADLSVTETVAPKSNPELELHTVKCTILRVNAVEPQVTIVSRLSQSSARAQIGARPAETGRTWAHTQRHLCRALAGGGHAVG